MPHMKSIASVLSIMALGLGLSGCPSSGGGGGGTETASGSFTRVALVPNQTDNTVSVFLVDDATGRLRPRGYVVSVASVSGASPRAIAVHPSGKFFYTINGGSDNVSAHVVSSIGLVTAVTGSPFSLTSATGPTAVAVSPNGLFLFVANQTTSNVSVLSINQTTGALAEITPDSPFSLAPAVGPTAIAVHPSGNLLFVTNNNNNASTLGTVSVVSIQTTGSLTQIGSPVSLVLNPQALALNAPGTVVYVANKGSNSISAFSVDQNTGDLTPINNQPFLTGAGTAPSSVAVSPGGQFLYVANSGTGTIGLFPIDPVTGVLSLPSTIPMISTGAKPQFIRIDPAGRTLYATDSILNLVDFFSIDPVAGTLTPAGTRAMKDSPGALAFVSGTSAVTPTPTFAYVANAGGNTVSAFGITPANGLLTPIAGSPFPVAGTVPVSLSADPLNRFVFVGNSGTNDVSAFTINSTTGNLSGITGSPFPLALGTTPQSVATDPLGRYLYVVNKGSDNVSAFSIASGTGILTAVAGSPFSTGVGTGPSAVTVEPSGQFAYVVYTTTNQVSLFTITQATGALVPTGAPLPLAATAAVPRAVVVDPAGRFLYVVNNGSGPLSATVSAYTINSANGSLIEIGGSPFSVAPGIGLLSLSADPLGQLLYVANGTTGEVSAFGINQTSGALVLLAGSPFTLVPATSPQSIAVDLSARFAYVANGPPNNNVSAFAIDQTTGALSAVGSPIAAGLSPSAITTIGRF